MKPAVVVPNWNGKDFLSDCIDSLLSQTMACQIVVVDNGSTDGSKETVRDRYPQVELIERDRNYGFVGGVNPGITWAIQHDCEYVALFNNDAVAEPDWLKRLVACAEAHPRVGIVTGKFLQFGDRERLDSTGDFYSVWGYPFPRGRGEIDQGQYDQLTEVFGASGGASLYRVSMLRQIGLFDQDFFAYYEDVDLSFRAQLAGWGIRFEPTAKAYHRIGGTSSRIKTSRGAATEIASEEPSDFARYHSIKNFVYLYQKNMPGWLYWKYLPRFTVGFAFIAASSIRRRQFEPFWRAVGQILLKSPATLGKRWRVQRLRKVSSAQIDAMLYHELPPTQKSLLRLRKRITNR